MTREIKEGILFCRSCNMVKRVFLGKDSRINANLECPKCLKKSVYRVSNDMFANIIYSYLFRYWGPNVKSESHIFSDELNTILINIPKKMFLLTNVVYCNICMHTISKCECNKSHRRGINLKYLLERIENYISSLVSCRYMSDITRARMLILKQLMQLCMDILEEI